MVLGAMDCKLVIPQLDSERHPDLAVYLAPPRCAKTAPCGGSGRPEIAIEVVSPDSGERDYVHKREEYWSLGIKEY